MWNWSKLTKLTCHLMEHSNQQLNQPLLLIELPHPPTFTCPRPLSAPITYPSSHHSSMHLASRTTSRNRGAAGYPKPLPSQSLQKSACRPAVKQPPRGICLIYRAEMSRCGQHPVVASAVLKMIWLVFSVTGGSDRLCLVVVTSFALSEPLGVLNQFLPTSHSSWTGCLVF